MGNFAVATGAGGDALALFSTVSSIYQFSTLLWSPVQRGSVIFTYLRFAIASLRKGEMAAVGYGARSGSFLTLFPGPSPSPSARLPLVCAVALYT